MSSKPDFIFVGPGRSGTTFMYHYLKQHADVSLAKDVKEINYFNDLFEKKSSDWYQNFFRKESGEIISGEIANMYFYDMSVPEKIKSVAPSAKIITILRNPYERIISAYQYRCSVGEITNLGFEDSLKQFPDLIEQNQYYTLLSEYYRHFDASQIHVLFYDDLKQNADKFLENINEILGIKNIDYTFNEQNKNSRQDARFKLIARAVRIISDFLRKFHLYKIHGWLKNSSLVRRLVFKKSSNIIELSCSGKEMLQESLQHEIDNLSEFLGKDLSSWKLSL